MRGKRTADLGFHTNYLRVAEMSAIVVVHADDEALPAHDPGNGDSKQLQGRRSEVGEASTGAKLESGRGDDEWHEIRRVGGMRSHTVGLEHLLGVAVVGRDEADAPE